MVCEILFLAFLRFDLAFLCFYFRFCAWMAADCLCPSSSRVDLLRKRRSSSSSSESAVFLGNPLHLLGELLYLLRSLQSWKYS